MSCGTECTYHWHGIHHFPVMSQSNAFLDTVQPESKHSQPRENYGAVFTNHTGTCLWSRYLKHSRPVDGSTAYSSDSRRDTLSKASRAEVVGKRVQRCADTLPCWPALFYELSGCNRKAHEWLKRAMGRMWYSGSQCCTEHHGGQRVYTCHQDTQTNCASSLAIATPTTPCIPGGYWSHVESWIVRSKHCRRCWSHCTHGWETDFWQISTSHGRICWRSNSWWPNNRILVELHDYDLINILLCFTRAHRDGLCDLQLYAFKQMLPFFIRYDHINCARWGSVYLAEMSDLPQEVLHEFLEGLVVKRTNRKFNQGVCWPKYRMAKCHRKEEWRLGRYHQDIVGNQQMQSQTTPMSPSNLILHPQGWLATPWTPLSCGMVGRRQIISILANSGRKNFIWILNQYPFL